MRKVYCFCAREMELTTSNILKANDSKAKPTLTQQKPLELEISLCFFGVAVAAANADEMQTKSRNLEDLA